MDWSADTPPTAKDIASYFRYRIARGELEPLQPLPAGRKLGKQLGVATMTVQSAYAQLREEGLVESRQGSGTYVRAAEGEDAAQGRAQGLRELQDQIRHVTSQLADLADRVAKLEDERPPASGKGDE